MGKVLLKYKYLRTWKVRRRLEDDAHETTTTFFLYFFCVACSLSPLLLALPVCICGDISDHIVCVGVFICARDASLFVSKMGCLQSSNKRASISDRELDDELKRLQSESEQNASISPNELRREKQKFDIESAEEEFASLIKERERERERDMDTRNDKVKISIGNDFTTNRITEPPAHVPEFKILNEKVVIIPEKECITIIIDKSSTAEQVFCALGSLKRHYPTIPQLLNQFKNNIGLMEELVRLFKHENFYVAFVAIDLFNSFALIPDFTLDALHVPGAFESLMEVLLNRKDLRLSALTCISSIALNVEAASELRTRTDLLLWSRDHLFVEDDVISLRSTMVLANIADEETLKKLHFPLKKISFILKTLESGITGNKRLRKFIRNFDFDFLPCTRSIRSLSVAETYRKFLFQEKAIELLVQSVDQISFRMLNEKENQSLPIALDHVFASLTQFALDDYPLKSMQISPLKEEILSLCQQCNKPEFTPQIRRGAEALQFVVEGKQMHMNVETSTRNLSMGTNEAPLVMISYNWSYQAQARQIEKVLVKNGIKVWRDENEMNGNIIDKMAEAVSNAQFVIVLISRFYKASANCKLECQFAHNNKKKLIPVLVESGYDFSADGWLGILLGSLLYYDATNTNTLEANVTKLIQHEIFSKSTAVLDHVSAVSLEAPKKTEPPHVPVPDNPEEIRAWCKSRDMEEMADILIDAQFVNANDLRDLASMAKPENLKSLFDVEIKPKLRVKLLAALKEIT